MEVIETQKRKTKLIEVSFFNILRTERRKTEMTIRILLSKIAGKQKTKTDGSNSIFNVVGKRKTKTEPRVLFSDDVGKKKRKLEAQIPFSYFAGKRLALRYTHYFNPKNLTPSFSALFANFKTSIHISLSRTICTRRKYVIVNYVYTRPPSFVWTRASSDHGQIDEYCLRVVVTGS